MSKKLCVYPDEVVSKYSVAPKAFSALVTCVGQLVSGRSCPRAVPTLWHCLPLLCLAMDKDGGRWTCLLCCQTRYLQEFLQGFKRHKLEGFLDRLSARGSVRAGTTLLPK